MTSGTENKVGVSGKAGWRPAGNEAGFYSEAALSWETKSNKTLDSLNRYTQTEHTTRSHPLHKDELLVLICTWSAKYETYDIQGVGGTISPIGFISETPKCAETVQRFPTTHKTMSYGIYSALKAGLSRDQFNDVIKNLEAKGVKVNKHRFDGMFKIINTYKCPGHEFCNWNLSWDTEDPHPMASVEKDGFTWLIEEAN